MKKNPEREAAILRSKIIDKYNGLIVIQKLNHCITVTENGIKKEFSYETDGDLCGILRNMLENGLPEKGFTLYDLG